MGDKWPTKHGLYDTKYEHDACGVGFVADIQARASHKIVKHGLQILENLTHRGAVGANPTTGDGAGIMVQTPDAFLRAVCDFDLPNAGDYACGMLFMPQDNNAFESTRGIIDNIVISEGLTLLGWRRVPTCRQAINDEVAASEPQIWQLFIATNNALAGDDFERRLFIVRKQMENDINMDDDAAGFYCCSLSSRTVIYKGMFLANQLGRYYPDLTDSRFASAMAIIHQRFSTNTFPAWKLAHPYRYIAHNGEINTLRGNLNNMRARYHSMTSPLWGDNFHKILPLVNESQSDTASLDNAIELLRLSGYSPAHTLSVLIPEAWQNNSLMSSDRRNFYAYHAPMMEPWDGPAEVVFSDGEQIATVLDRNGLRPGRYWITDDNLIIMASESGVLDIADNRINYKGFIEPGKILLVDLKKKAIIDDNTIKQDMINAYPYRQWQRQSQTAITELANVDVDAIELSSDERLRLQQNFGYTEEDIKFILRPMIEDAAEPVGAMGDDAPVAVLSTRMKPLSAYFRQEFAQVTNPPIDPIREEIVMSLMSYLGPRHDLLRPLDQPQTSCLVLKTPILSAQEFANIKDNTHPEYKCQVLDITWQSQHGAEGMETALTALRERALKSVYDDNVKILILSDRAVDAQRIAIPIYLAVAAVHHYLVANGERTRVGIVVDTGAAREVHDFAVLAGYGAEAFYPYVAYATVMSLAMHKGHIASQKRVERYRKAVGKGLLKTMSKMGVSTFQSYCGAQIFEAVGLAKDFVNQYFCGTVSQIGGVGIRQIAEETAYWHSIAHSTKPIPLYQNTLDAGGDYAYRTRGESHMWTPQTVAALQHAVRDNRHDKYEEYSALINQQNERLMTLRGLLALKESSTPVAIDDVESASEIVKRFSTGAMSFGSISYEAHTTLAIAMNRIGGKSNTGEGGEKSQRFIPLANGDSMRSAIKQVASGRFGVTAEYLANSDVMQIKIAQGAKPGEGGQLPGHKVDSAIAQVRHSVPGVGLISPPPHHDIYSIEDIAQLIYDLKSANPKGQVSVKLVSRYGVGTVAAGVVKAKSDHVTIAGHDGGTGASPLSSIKHAGTPWELGLSETHQTLVLNDLRGRVALQVDGQIKTGRDVVIGALLGADEFGFATAPLVAQGCIMMRKCHLNTCPVGIATQDKHLRAKFSGQPEHVVNYFFFVAEEVRRLLAALGYCRLNDIIGRADLLQQVKTKNWKQADIDLSAVLALPQAPKTYARYHVQNQQHDIDKAIDMQWLARCQAAIEHGEKVVIDDTVKNTNRTVGAIISHAIASRHGHAGLAKDTLTFNLTGVGGQSFGAFASKGMLMRLQGEANDYLGKGLSGGILAIYPPPSARKDEDNAIVGNTALYGAICGECYCRGAAGVRFAVRNSGAHVVVERVGDHCCEYMTGGTVVVLGAVGHNFAAGMSGGVAYILDEDGGFTKHCNLDTVTIEPLVETPGVGQHQGRADTDIVHELLSSHWHYTQSPKARTILDDWEFYRTQFVRVMPDEYQRALLELAKVAKTA